MPCEASSLHLRHVKWGFPKIGVATETTFLSALAQGLCWEAAVRHLSQMKSGDAKPNVITFSSAIRAAEMGSAWEHVLKLLSDMPGAAIKPDTIVMTSCIGASYKAAHWAQAVHLFSSMDSVSLTPDVFCFNNAIAAWAFPGHWKATLTLLERLRLSKLQPVGDTLASCVSACGQAAQWEAALLLLQDLGTEGLLISTWGEVIPVLVEGGLLQAEMETLALSSVDPDAEETTKLTKNQRAAALRKEQPSAKAAAKGGSGIGTANAAGKGNAGNPKGPGKGNAGNPKGPGKGNAGNPKGPGKGNAGNPKGPGKGNAGNPKGPGKGNAGNPKGPGKGNAGNPKGPGKGNAGNPKGPGKGNAGNPKGPGARSDPKGAQVEDMLQWLRKLSPDCPEGVLARVPPVWKDDLCGDDAIGRAMVKWVVTPALERQRIMQEDHPIPDQWEDDDVAGLWAPLILPICLMIYLHHPVEYLANTLEFLFPRVALRHGGSQRMLMLMLVMVKVLRQRMLMLMLVMVKGLRRGMLMMMVLMMVTVARGEVAQFGRDPECFDISTDSEDDSVPGEWTDTGEPKHVDERVGRMVQLEREERKALAEELDRGLSCTTPGLLAELGEDLTLMKLLQEHDACEREVELGCSSLALCRLRSVERELEDLWCESEKTGLPQVRAVKVEPSSQMTSASPEEPLHVEGPFCDLRDGSVPGELSQLVHPNFGLDTPELVGKGAQPTPGALLQTRIVPQAEVWQNLEDWRQPLTDEVVALKNVHRAVWAIGPEELKRLEQLAVVSVIPAKGVFTQKPITNRLRARVVGCGNFLENDAPAEDVAKGMCRSQELYAGGVDGVSVRLQTSVAAMNGWGNAVLDIKTAFLGAPLYQDNQGHALLTPRDLESGNLDFEMLVKKLRAVQGDKVKIVVVSPPKILVRLGLIEESEKWLVIKVLYGLAEAPRRWSAHRDLLLRQLFWEDAGRRFSLVQCEADANLWRVVSVQQPDSTQDVDASSKNPSPEIYTGNPQQEDEGLKLHGLLGVYVDDMLITADGDTTESLIRELRAIWSTSEPEVAEVGRKDTLHKAMGVKILVLSVLLATVAAKLVITVEDSGDEDRLANILLAVSMLLAIVAGYLLRKWCAEKRVEGSEDPSEVRSLRVSTLRESEEDQWSVVENTAGNQEEVELKRDLACENRQLPELLACENRQLPELLACENRLYLLDPRKLKLPDQCQVSQLSGRRQWPRGLELMEEMARHATKGDLRTYTAALTVCEGGSLWERAVHLLSSALELRPSSSELDELLQSAVTPIYNANRLAEEKLLKKDKREKKRKNAEAMDGSPLAGGKPDGPDGPDGPGGGAAAVGQPGNLSIGSATCQEEEGEREEVMEEKEREEGSRSIPTLVLLVVLVIAEVAVVGVVVVAVPVTLMLYPDEFLALKDEGRFRHPSEQDLHDLTLETALVAVCEELLRFAVCQLQGDLIVVTGVGKNSPGEPVLLPAVRMLLEEFGLHAEPLPMPGRLRVPSPAVALCNTIPTNMEPEYPGDLTLESRISNLVRWNAAVMVSDGNRRAAGVGGHIGTFASICDIFEALLPDLEFVEL
ncbi:Pyruvate dehydrogenase E1 component [Symbiodinium microadriaticum]|uniref:Pyruvate dehydrogenase E1 component n=1 Tax=Symbiodinium microadriaticum TaxID=2951 RepID=A0A1Q9CJL1_SYMMI|nr:Pyruvate dehydrogenase E1 component [Symbiodinium microadriaticum]